MPTRVSYPSGRSVSFNVGVGMHDISLLASGNGWSAASITAHAGGGQALGTPITTAQTLIAVSATAGDSCQLPPATGGQILIVSNAGAASSTIYCPPGTDQINAAPNGTGIALAAGKSMMFMSPLQGAWFTILSA